MRIKSLFASNNLSDRKIAAKKSEDSAEAFRKMLEKDGLNACTIL